MICNNVEETNCNRLSQEEYIYLKEIKPTLFSQHLQIKSASHPDLHTTPKPHILEFHIYERKGS